MKNKIALITGATSGIGKASAFAFGKAGINLIITGRNEKAGTKLVKQITKRYGIKIEFIKADLSSLNEVRSFCEKIKNKYEALDILVNNAGARFYQYIKSPDNIELTFATNYLSHFLTTLLLFDLLKKSESARIINLSSGAHWNNNIDINNILLPAEYDRRKAYGQSKLAMILFTYELSKRINKKDITVNALDPGGVATNLGRNNGLIAWSKHYISYLSRGTLVTPATAADAVLYLSTSEDLINVTGKFFFRKEMRKSSDVSYDGKLANDLWELSMKTCDITFNEN